MIKIRKADGSEVEYDSKKFDFRVLNAKLQIIYKNTSSVFFEFENGDWASALKTDDCPTKTG